LIRIWHVEQDEEGRPVTRSFDLPTTGVKTVRTTTIRTTARAVNAVRIESGRLINKTSLHCEQSVANEHSRCFGDRGENFIRTGAFANGV